MITTDFAPNDGIKDALASLITLLTPMTWKTGASSGKVTKTLSSWFPGTLPHLFLSGRGALHTALKAAGLEAGSEVLVQGFTCEAVVLPILQLGLRPVYADIETDTFSFDLSSVKARISPSTKAIILQHTFGIVPKYRDGVLQLAREKKLIIIEDLAHGFEPGFWQKQHLSDKHLLLLSFGRSKALSSVFGGAVIAGRGPFEAEIARLEDTLEYPAPAFIAKLLCYKPLTLLAKSTYNFAGLGKIIHFLAKKTGLLIAEISKKEKDGSYDPYLEKKYPDALANILLPQLINYQSTVGKRREATAVYRSAFPYTSSSVPSRFPLLTGKKGLILNDVRKKGVYLGNWYTQPVAPDNISLGKVGYNKGSCRTAEKVCGSIINLPTLVTGKEAARIVAMLKTYL